MSTASPFCTYAGLLERAPHLIHTYLRNDPSIVGYQFWGHNTVNDAYGDPGASTVGGAGPEAMFEVQRGASFRSNTLRRKGLGLVAESRRGTTHALFDVDDFITPAAGGSAIPEDEKWLFLRVQENRLTSALLALGGVPEATVTLAAVVATDRIVIKTVVFDFVAGANNLAGKAGTGGDPFLVGLGADDNAAAANLALALNDGGDVGPVMDAIALTGAHTFATNPGAPSAVVLIQPEDAGSALIPGITALFAITTPDAPRIVIDAAALALGTLVSSPDATSPVLGPIYCVPPADHFGMPEPTFTLAGIAPSGTSSIEGAVPNLDENITSAAPRAMYLVFARPLTALLLRNTSAQNLLVSYGPGQMMINIKAGAETALYAGSTKEILLACPDVGGATFTFTGVLGLG